MIRTIEAQVRDASSTIGHDHIDPRVLRVMGALPRHEFVPDDLQQVSYADRPLPIGYGQTISQPLIVALMTDVLNVDQSSVVLEVGTGSGYQAAVVAELARQVCTIEIIPDLARSAADRLSRLGYRNVTVRVGDGYFGWQDAAPFDGIIVTAAAAHIPPPLLDQLKPGGRMGNSCRPAIRRATPHGCGAWCRWPGQVPSALSCEVRALNRAASVTWLLGSTTACGEDYTRASCARPNSPYGRAIKAAMSIRLVATVLNPPPRLASR